MKKSLIFLCAGFLAALALLTGCEKQVSGQRMDMDLGGGVILETFSGTIKAGTPEGSGSAILSSGGVRWTYEGGFSESGPFAGAVTGMPAELTVGGQSISGLYTGQTMELIMSGQGLFTSTDGMTCKGVFDKGELSPWQSYEMTDMPCTLTLGGSQTAGTYTGTTQGDKPQGQGVFTAGDGSGMVMTGTFQDGLPADGGAEVTGLAWTLAYEGKELAGSYTGQLSGGLPEGEGSFVCELGEEHLTYTGSWAAGAMTGEGTLDTSMYVVHFVDGLDRTGSYTGQVLNGAASGEGSFTAVADNGTRYTYTGQWADGLWNGQGDRIFEDAPSQHYVGTYTAGEYTPTLREFIRHLGQWDPQYSLSEDALTTAERYAKGAAGESGGLSYEQYIKSPGSYTNQLMRFENYHVVQISENKWELFDETSGGTYETILTDMIIESADYDHVCYVYCIGALDGLYEWDPVTVQGYPLAYSSYQSVEDVTIKCIVLLGTEALY